MILPQARFCSWDNSEQADPDSSRHLVSGAFAFQKQIGTGCQDSLNISRLILNTAGSDPYVESEVAVVNFSFPNFSDLVASGYTSIDNMRLWIPSGSGSVLDLPGISLEFIASGQWTPNLVFPSGAGQALSSSLPLTPNIYRIDGSSVINGFNASNASQWIYLRFFVDAAFPVGTYGVCTSGTLRPRLTYDFY